MRYDLGLDDEKKNNKSRYWLPSSNILTVLVLLILVLFVLGVNYLEKNLEDVQASADMGQQGTHSNQMTDKDTAGQIGDESEAVLLKERLKELEQDIAQKEQELDGLQEVAALAKVRKNIAAELTEKLGELGLEIDIDQTSGKVRFSEGMLFDVDNTTISREGGEYLNKFVPAYLSVLLSDKNKGYIDQITVEGHADDGGSYQYNLDLSQKRSFATVQYIIMNNMALYPDGTDATQLFTIAGLGYHNH